MRIFLSIVFSLLLYGVGAFAESGQAPPINPSTSKAESATHQQQPLNDYINHPPFKVTITPPPKNDPERKSYEAPESYKSHLELGTIAVAIATAFILFFQLIVFNRQARRLGDTVEAMITSERPYLFAEVIGGISQSTMEPSKTNCTCFCYITNRGKTPAIISMADCKLIRVGEINFNYGLRDDGQITAKGIALGINDKPLEFDRSTDLLSGTLNGNLLLYGKVEYKDIFVKSHETEFEFIFVDNISSFCVSGNKERNHYT